MDIRPGLWTALAQALVGVVEAAAPGLLQRTRSRGSRAADATLRSDVQPGRSRHGPLALSMIMDPQQAHSLQQTPLPSITRRRYHARSPETYALADYWYCSCAADSPAPGFIVPAPWSPEPEGPSGAGEEAEGSATQGPDACGSCTADAEADTDAGGEDVGADAEVGPSWPVPFPESSSRAPTKALGATKVPPSRTPSELLTAPTVFSPSRSLERFQPSPPNRVKSAASATTLILTDLFRRGLLVGKPTSTDCGALLGSASISGYAAPAKVRGNTFRARCKSSMSWAALGYRSSESLVKSPITRASIASGTEGLRFVGGSGSSMTCFMAVASGPSATNGTVQVSIS